MNWRRSLIGVGVAVPIVALLAYGMTRDPNEMVSTLPGRQAPMFALPVMDSEPVDTVHLSELRGDIVVVNFWASWCLECRVEHGDLSRAALEYGDKGVHFFGILYQDDPESGRRWINAQGGQPYPALVDGGSRTAILYGLYGVPETVIIGRDGKVVHKQIGPFTSYAQISALLEPLLAASDDTGSVTAEPVSRAGS
ncbi:MAG TPA: TlpA disulfide reductase family protein [Longimicrobiales bacterium]|nr:TlpA disulfide reductase family protein [Longimicrobiales bacterium]